MVDHHESEVIRGSIVAATAFKLWSLHLVSRSCLAWKRLRLNPPTSQTLAILLAGQLAAWMPPDGPSVTLMLACVCSGP